VPLLAKYPCIADSACAERYSEQGKVVVLVVFVILTPTTMEPVWHKGPQILQTALGLIAGLMNSGIEVTLLRGPIASTENPSIG